MMTAPPVPPYAALAAYGIPVQHAEVRYADLTLTPTPTAVADTFQTSDGQWVIRLDQSFARFGLTLEDRNFLLRHELLHQAIQDPNPALAEGLVDAVARDLSKRLSPIMQGVGYPRQVQWVRIASGRICHCPWNSSTAAAARRSLMLADAASRAVQLADLGLPALPTAVR